MKTLSVLTAFCLLAGCQADYAPPVVRPETTRTGKQRHIDFARLEEGRRLFASRCIECHTLPVIWHYNTDEWPGIVDSMAHRASLKPNERESIVAYILAARAQ